MTLPKIAALQNLNTTKVLKGITYVGLAFVVADLAWYMYRGPKRLRTARR